MKTQKGFTLIELLVVIAILAGIVFQAAHHLSSGGEAHMPEGHRPPPAHHEKK